MPRHGLTKVFRLSTQLRRTTTMAPDKYHVVFEDIVTSLFNIGYYLNGDQIKSFGHQKNLLNKEEE